MLLNEHAFLERFEAAARAGFEAVERLLPHAFDPLEIRRRLDANGLELVLHKLPAGDWETGERGVAYRPDRVDEFRTGVAEAPRHVRALGVRRLNGLAAGAGRCRRRGRTAPGAAPALPRPGGNIAARLGRWVGCGAVETSRLLGPGSPERKSR